MAREFDGLLDQGQALYTPEPEVTPEEQRYIDFLELVWPHKTDPISVLRLAEQVEPYGLTGNQRTPVTRGQQTWQFFPAAPHYAQASLVDTIKLSSAQGILAPLGSRVVHPLNEDDEETPGLVAVQGITSFTNMGEGPFRKIGPKIFGLGTLALDPKMLFDERVLQQAQVQPLDNDKKHPLIRLKGYGAGPLSPAVDLGRYLTQSQINDVLPYTVEDIRVRSIPVIEERDGQAVVVGVNLEHLFTTIVVRDMRQELSDHRNNLVYATPEQRQARQQRLTDKLSALMSEANRLRAERNSLTDQGMIRKISVIDQRLERLQRLTEKAFQPQS